jgi:glucosamine-6-phosphate deaminase
MKIEIFENKKLLGAKAAADAAALIVAALEAGGSSRIIAATGASQFDFLECLTGYRAINWQNVTMFHLDEYVGLDANHPASFRRYLRERLASKVEIGTCHYLNPEGNPLAECGRVGRLLQEAPVDAAFVGIGENGHLAFNDPPADFETEEPYLLVNLDAQCRTQQLGEGWFPSLDQVPTQAVSMSIRQILKSRAILCIVPEARKAKAVRASLHEPVSPMVPASILRTHPNVVLYLDRDSASLLASDGTLRGAQLRGS